MQGSKKHKHKREQAKTKRDGTAMKSSGCAASQGWDGRKQMRSSKNLGFGST